MSGATAVVHLDMVSAKTSQSTLEKRFEVIERKNHAQGGVKSSLDINILCHVSDMFKEQQTGLCIASEEKNSKR